MKATNPIAHTNRLSRIIALGLAALFLVQSAPGALIGHWVSGSANLADTSGFTPAGTHDGVAVGANAGLLAWSSDVPSGFAGQSLDLTAFNVGVLITNTATDDGNYQNTFDQGISNMLTVTFWFRGTGTFQGVWVGKSGNTPMGWKCRPLSPKADFTVRNNGLGEVGFPSALGSINTITNDRWYHYAAVFDGTASFRKIYLDGVFEAQTTGTSYCISFTNVSHLIIGANQGNTNGPISSFFPGKMYDVRIYNTALSSDEVYNAMTEPVTPEAHIVSFGLPGNPAVITGTNILWTVPYGTAVTNLAPFFSLSVGATCDRVSGSTNDFSTPQVYTVISSDYLITNVYTATVVVTPASTAKDILAFGPGAVITGTNIAWTMPFGTVVTALTPTYTVSPFAAGAPPSGTARNFTTPQTYTVTAQDLSTKDYVVTVIVTPPSTAKDILTFGPGAVITGTNILWRVPFDTDVTTLAPTYTVSPFASGAPPSGTSGDFTTPQTYTVTAQDLSTKDYLVTVIVLVPTINVNYYGGPKPGNADMDGYASDDPTVRGTASQVAPYAYVGTNWNDFNSSSASSPDLLDSMGALSGIGLATTMQGGPWNDWTGLGNVGSGITNRMLVSGLIANYPSYADIFTLAGLNPSNQYDLYIASQHNTLNRNTDFLVGGTSINVSYIGATDWTSGQNYAHFAGLIPTPDGTIRVRARTTTGEIVLNGFQLQDMGTRGLNSDAAIYSFVFPEFGAATINGTNITRTAPFAADLTALAPTYTASVGATVDKDSGSVHDFSGPVTYTVISEDTTVTNVYTVTVTPGPNPVTALIGHWVSGNQDLVDSSGHTPPGTHDGAAAGPNAGLLGFTNEVPPGFSGSSLDLTAGGLGDVGVMITNTKTTDAGYTNTFDNPILSRFTITFWAKGFPANGWAPWVSKNGESSGWQVRRLGGSQNPTFTIRGTGNDDPDTGINVDDGNWHHYAGVFDGVAGTRSLYVDGVDYLDLSGLYGTVANPNDSWLMLGARDNGGVGEYFNGLLFDVRIYNIPLFSSQVYAVMMSPNGPFVDITNIPSTVDVPFGTANIDIAGTNNEYTVGDLWWTNELDGSSGVVPADSVNGWTFNTTLALGTNIITVSGTNVLGMVYADSATVNVVPEPVAAGAAAVVGYLVFGIRRRR